MPDIAQLHTHVRTHKHTNAHAQYTVEFPWSCFALCLLSLMWSVFPHQSRRDPVTSILPLVLHRVSLELPTLMTLMRCLACQSG